MVKKKKFSVRKTQGGFFLVSKNGKPATRRIRGVSQNAVFGTRKTASTFARKKNTTRRKSKSSSLGFGF